MVSVTMVTSLLMAAALTVAKVTKAKRPSDFKDFPFPANRPHSHTVAMEVCAENFMTLPQPKNADDNALLQEHVDGRMVYLGMKDVYPPDEYKLPDLGDYYYHDEWLEYLEGAVIWMWNGEPVKFTSWQGSSWKHSQQPNISTQNKPPKISCAVQLGRLGVTEGGMSHNWMNVWCDHNDARVSKVTCQPAEPCTDGDISGMSGKRYNGGCPENRNDCETEWTQWEQFFVIKKNCKRTCGVCKGVAYGRPCEKSPIDTSYPDNCDWGAGLHCNKKSLTCECHRGLTYSSTTGRCEKTDGTKWCEDRSRNSKWCEFWYEEKYQHSECSRNIKQSCLKTCGVCQGSPYGHVCLSSTTCDEGYCFSSSDTCDKKCLPGDDTCDKNSDLYCASSGRRPGRCGCRPGYYFDRKERICKKETA